MLIPGLCSRSSGATDILWYHEMDEKKWLVFRLLKISQEIQESQQNKNAVMDAFLMIKSP